MTKENFYKTVAIVSIIGIMIVGLLVIGLLSKVEKLTKERDFYKALLEFSVPGDENEIIIPVSAKGKSLDVYIEEVHEKIKGYNYTDINCDTELGYCKVILNEEETKNKN